MAKNKNSQHVINWQKKNPERYLAKMRAWRWKNKYGITPEEYQAKLDSQGGVCAICKTSPTAKRLLAVDHCHMSKKVRGLLCHVCNNLLGVYETRKDAFHTYLLAYGEI